MVPYLSGALEKVLLKDKNFEHECILNTVASEPSMKGIVVLDPSLKIVYRNQNAAGLLSGFHSYGRKSEGAENLPSEIYLQCKRLIKDETPATSPVKLEVVQKGSRQKIWMQAKTIRVPGKGPLFVIYLEPRESTLCLSQALAARGLTRRERDVVHLVFKGLKNKEIAEELFISPYTVDNHLRSIYRKMDVRNRASIAHHLLKILMGEDPSRTAPSRP